MILETVRILADWLADPTYGLNAVRPSVPKDTDVTDFPTVQVFDSTRDGRVTRGGVPNLEPADFPCVLVSPADQPIEDTNPTVAPWPSDTTVTVLVRYATRVVDAAKGERDASQTLRAVRRCIRRLILDGRTVLLPGQTSPDSACRRADVQLISVERLQAATLYESTEDATVTGGVLVTCHVRDIWTQS